MLNRDSFDAYSDLVKGQADAAAAKVRAYAAKIDWTGDDASKAAAREALQEYAYDVVTSYGDNAASIAAKYYDESASDAGRTDIPEAQLADYPERAQVDANIAYATRAIWGKGGSNG